MSINNPNQLVHEFKKSGEFDRLRRELLMQFQHSEGMESFIARVEDVAQKRLDADHKLQYVSPEILHRELLQELDRYPIVERALTDMHMLSDPSFSAGIRKHAQKILRQDRGETVKDDDGVDGGSPEAIITKDKAESSNMSQTPGVRSPNANSQTQSNSQVRTTLPPETTDPPRSSPEVNGTNETHPPTPTPNVNTTATVPDGPATSTS